MSLGLLALLLLFLLYENNRFNRTIFNEAERQGSFLFSTSSLRVSDYLYFNNVEDLRQHAEALSAQNAIRRYVVFNAEGQNLFDSEHGILLESSFDAELVDLARRSDGPATRKNVDSIEFLGTIRFDGRTLGGLYFELDLTSQFNEAATALRQSAINGSLIVALLIATMFGLTNVRGTRRSLETAERNFKALIDQSPLALAIFQNNGNLSYLNSAARKLLDLHVNESAYNLLEDQALKPVSTQVENGVKEPTNVGRFEYTGTIEDGDAKFLQAVVFPLLSSNLYYNEFVVIFSDVSVEVRAEQQKEQMNDMLIQRQKLEGLGVMARGIAHDFNNLLTPVMASADLLQKDLGSDPIHSKLLRNIVTGAAKASELCKQLLTYGGSENRTREFADVSREVEEMHALISSSVPKTIVFNKVLAEKLPLVEIDRSQFRQIVLNLLINASEAIGVSDGQITLSTGVETLDEDEISQLLPSQNMPSGEYIYVRVVDTGEGMDEHTLANLFDPFFSTRFTGRGLGMSVVLGILGDHKGGILVESSPAGGTTVNVYFPPGDTPAPLKDTSHSSPRGLTGGSVLLADDDPQVLNINRQILETMDFNVITASDGQEAVEFFRDHSDQICCAVLDLMMPVLDGEGAIDQLHDIVPDLPVVIVTGLKSAESFERLMHRPHVKVLSKPYLMDDLKQAMQEVMKIT